MKLSFKLNKMRGFRNDHKIDGYLDWMKLNITEKNVSLKADYRGEKHGLEPEFQNRGGRKRALQKEVKYRRDYLEKIRPRTNAVIKLLSDMKGESGLDVGIGYGYPGIILNQKFGVKVTGVEHPLNIEANCTVAESFGIKVIPWKFSEPIPVSPNSQDFIIFSEVLEHLKLAPAYVMRTLKNMLRHGGLLVLTTPNICRQENIEKLETGHNIVEEYKNDVPDGEDPTDFMIHVREYSIEEVVSLLENSGFEVVAGYTCNQWPPDKPLDNNPLKNDIQIFKAVKL